jgi:hypothetical protein
MALRVEATRLTDWSWVRSASRSVETFIDNYLRRMKQS